MTFDASLSPIKRLLIKSLKESALSMADVISSSDGDKLLILDEDNFTRLGVVRHAERIFLLQITIACGDVGKIFCFGNNCTKGIGTLQ